MEAVVPFGDAFVGPSTFVHNRPANYVTEFFKVPSFTDISRITSTGDLFQLDEVCKVPDVLPLISDASDASDMSERLALGELELSIESHPESEQPIFPTLGSTFDMGSPEPVSTSMLNLTLNTSEVINTWNAISGGRPMMHMVSDDILSLAPSIPSSTHLNASLNMLVDCNAGHFGAPMKQYLIRSSSEYSDADGSMIVPVDDCSNPSRSSTPMLEISSMKPKVVSKPVARRKHNSHKRRHSATRSFVDKRPRYKGRFVRPEELELLLAMERGQQEENAVVPDKGAMEVVNVHL